MVVSLAASQSSEYHLIHTSGPVTIIKLTSIISRPQCKENPDAMKLQRRIGYFEMFNLDQRKCDRFLPEHIAAGALTHVNLAFALISNDFKITEDNADVVTRGAHLKDRFDGLRVNIAIGGWAFNDPPTETIWSDMARSYDNTLTFIDSLVEYLNKFGLDGVRHDHTAVASAGIKLTRSAGRFGLGVPRCYRPRWLERRL